MKVEEIYSLEPLNNKVILKQNKITTSSTGIILMADTAEKETFCEVVAADSDLVNRGDTVFADPYVGVKLLEDDDALYVLVDESDILAVRRLINE